MINLAKYYYEKFYEIGIPQLGPYIDRRNLNKLQGRKFTSLNKEYLPRIAEEIKKCKKDFINREIYVPSPWHAWVFLVHLHPRMCNINLQWDVPGNFIVPAYRGQTNANLSPVPSLFRDGTNRKIEKRNFEIFSFIFNQESLWQHSIVKPSQDMAKAAAQHYGIKTDLLDITADPAIAIYFASKKKSNNALHRTCKINSVVYLFDLQIFLKSNVKLILPHPVVKRLYLQQGAFLSIPEHDIERLIKSVTRIVFPFDPEFKCLGIENGSNILDENENSWLNKIVSWSKIWAKSEDVLPNNPVVLQELLLRIFDDCGYPDIYNNSNQHNMNWISNLENILYSYAIRINDEFTHEGILSGVLENICKNNKEIIKFMIKIWSLDSKQSKLASICKQLI